MRTPDEERRAEMKAQGRRLTAARVAAGLPSRDAAAKYLKVSAITYAQHENGTTGITRSAKRYADSLNVPVEWLLHGSNPPLWAVGGDEVESEAPEAYHHLREWRLFRKLGVEDLADAARAPAEAIARWETGEGEISPLMLQRLADVLETTPGMILDVDPGALTANQLEGWLDVVRGQAEARERASRLRAA